MLRSVAKTITFIRSAKSINESSLIDGFG